MEANAGMTQLTSVSGSFRANVLVARLVSEGIDAQPRGSLDSPYGFTVGDMARVDVYVPADQLEDARYVLLADEVDATLAAPTEWWDAGAARLRGTPRWIWWVALALLTVAVVAPLLGYVARW